MKSRNMKAIRKKLKSNRNIKIVETENLNISDYKETEKLTTTNIVEKCNVYVVEEIIDLSKIFGIGKKRKFQDHLFQKEYDNYCSITMSCEKITNEPPIKLRRIENTGKEAKTNESELIEEAFGDDLEINNTSIESSKNCFSEAEQKKKYRSVLRSKLQNKSKKYNIEKFSREHGFRRHMAILHDKECYPWKCDTCNESFDIITNYIFHQNMDHDIDMKSINEKLYLCYICADAEKSGNKLICGICSKTYKTLDSLISHRKRYHDIKFQEIRCRYCKQVFPNNVGLNKHIKAEHSNEKCKLCEKEFEDLYKHLKRNHLNDRLKCKYCSQEFSFLSSLKEHERKRHTGENNLICNICEWGAPDHYFMKRHMLEHDKNLDENGNYLPVPPIDMSLTGIKCRVKGKFIEVCCGPDEPGICYHISEDIENQRSNSLINSKFTDTSDLRFFVVKY